MKNSLWIIFSLLYTGLSAQVAVSGKVLNEQGQPIEYAEVLLKTQNDSTQIAHTLTNKTGDFSLSVTKGNYTLSVDYFGQEVFNKKISLVSNANLGTLKVKTANVIGKVTVTGKKPCDRKKSRPLHFQCSEFPICQRRHCFRCAKSYAQTSGGRG